MSCIALSNNQKNELLFVGFNQDYGKSLFILVLAMYGVYIVYYFMCGLLHIDKLKNAPLQGSHAVCATQNRYNAM